MRPRISFLALLFIFLALFLVGPLLPNHYNDLFVNITFSIFILLCIFVLRMRRFFFIIASLAALIAIILNSITYFNHSFAVELFGSITALLFLSGITFSLFKHVFFSRSVETDKVFGSICTYILLGTVWAILYSLVELFSPNAFSGLVALAGTTPLDHGVKFQLFLYYSFITQTTLGYGDITPLIPLACNLAAVQAIMGIFYLATLVASLIDNFARQKAHL